MESDVFNSIEESPRTSYLYSRKLPVRSSSEKHSYKRHSWLLPEGQTVLEKQQQLRGKKHRRNSDHAPHQQRPQITFFIDLFTLLRNLFQLTAEQFEEAARLAETQELHESYNAVTRVILKKGKKIDDLQDLYVHQQHMREGATNLINTLESLKPLNKSTKARLDECRQQRQKNIERLFTVEEEVNSMAGSLKFQILGLLGFSRVCPGDVYEVTFKLASQKWKAKCKIEALGQTWVDPEFCFQAKAAYDMSVKVAYCVDAFLRQDVDVKNQMVEIGKLTKTTLIGSVGCSIQEFLLPEPQESTHDGYILVNQQVAALLEIHSIADVYLLPINSTGTVKLKLGVVWSPLGVNDHREILSQQQQQQQAPSLFSEVNFTNTPVVNLRRTQEAQYASPTRYSSSGSTPPHNQHQPQPLSNSMNYPSPASYENGGHFNYNESFESPYQQNPRRSSDGLVYHHDRQRSGESHASSGSSGSQQGLVRSSGSHGALGRVSSMNKSRQFSPAASPMDDMMSELKRKTSKKYVANGSARPLSESHNSSYDESGYHSSREELPFHRHNNNNNGVTQSPQPNTPSSSHTPLRKTSSNKNFMSPVQPVVPEDAAPVNNIVRLTTVPLQPNAGHVTAEDRNFTSALVASDPTRVKAPLNSTPLQSSYDSTDGGMVTKNQRKISSNENQRKISNGVATNARSENQRKISSHSNNSYNNNLNNGIVNGLTPSSSNNIVSHTTTTTNGHSQSTHTSNDGVLLLRQKYLSDTHHSKPNASSAPPPVKSKPSLKRKSSFGSLGELSMLDEIAATPKLIEICDRILQKLCAKNELMKKIPDLERKMTEVQRSLQQFHAKQNRKPSITDSVEIALASFSFLKDEDARSVASSTFSNTSNDSNVFFILPKQWKRSHRALRHHLYMLYDVVCLFEPGVVPLTERETSIIHCIHKQKFFIKEIMELISTPDDIELHRVCKQFTGSSTLTNTWEVSADLEQPLYCSTDDMQKTVSALYQHLEMEDGGDGTTVADVQLKEKVCRKAVRELSELKIYYTDEHCISLFQFVDFFRTKVKSHNVVGFLKTLKLEEIALRGLKSKDDLVVMTTLQQYWTIPVAASCVQRLLLFVANDKSSARTVALNALVQIYAGESKQLVSNSSVFLHEKCDGPQGKGAFQDVDVKFQLLNLLYAALEEKDIQLRVGACIVLGRCKEKGTSQDVNVKNQVYTSSQKLTHIFNHDEPLVKQAAESALKELGRTHIRH